MDVIEYPLSGRLDYYRSPRATGLLYAMFQQVSKKERESGEVCEFAFVYFSPRPDGDYVGVALMQGGDHAQEDQPKAAVREMRGRRHGQDWGRQSA